MLNNNDNLSYADKAFFEQLEKFSKELEQMTKTLKVDNHKSIWDSLDEEEKAEEEKNLKEKRNFLKKIKSKLQNMSDSVAETIVITGEMLHSSKEDKAQEYKVNKIISELDVELTKEDFNAVCIVNYLSNTTVMPTRESHTLAETNLAIANRVKRESKNAAKLALLNNAMIPLIIEKNINKSAFFAKAYANRDNYNIDEKIIIASIEKLKEFNDTKTENEKLIGELCRLNFADSTKENIKKVIDSFKESIMKKTQISVEPNSLLDDNYTMTNDEFTTIPTPMSDKNDIFIEFAKKYLELELPDPGNKLENKLNELICTQANKLYTPSYDTKEQTPKHSYNRDNHLKL